MKKVVLPCFWTNEVVWQWLDVDAAFFPGQVEVCSFCDDDLSLDSELFMKRPRRTCKAGKPKMLVDPV